MKKLILWLLLTMFVAALSIAYADTVQIGTGTSTTSYLPLYGLYGYNYTQQIYTQTQIGVSGNIEKIRFYYVSGTITNSKDWVIYMGHTTKTTFSSSTDWEPLANLNQVFAGDVSSMVPLANNWMEITLDTPFNYNNTDNLIIAVDENTSGYASMSWGAFTSGTNTGIYYYNDNINPDPASPPTANSRTSSINRIQLVFPSTSAPLAPTLVSPSDEATGVALNALLTWSATAGGGDATSYDVYMDTVDGSTLVSENQVEASYSVTLAYGTTYYWKVVASNAIGDSPASDVWSFTAMADPTIVVFPWVEDFGTETTDTFPPQNWTRMGGQYPTTSGTNTLWARGNWLNGATGNNDAKMNIYGTSRYAWIISPPIAIPATGYELKIDLGLTDYGNGNPIEDPTSQLDDKFIVAISSSPDMSNPTILREWNNSGSEYVYNEIPNTGTTAILDLDGYVGTYYVAFYGESTLTGGDNDFHFDNVTVRETPESPIISVTPDTWDFGTQLINTTTAKEFTISNIGAGSLNVSSINVTGTGFTLAEAFSPVSLLPTQSTTVTVNFSPLTEANYIGNIAINDNRATTNIPLTGAAVDVTIYAGDLPYLENFDAVIAPAMPNGWATIPGTTGSARTQTSNPASSPNTLYMYSSGASTIAMVSLPPISLSSTNLRIKFNGRSNVTAGGIVDIGSMTDINDPATFTLIGSRTLSTLTYQAYSVDLGTVNGIMNYAIRASHTPANSILLDDITFEIPAPIPPEPATLVWPLNGITTLPNPLLKWAPSATGEPVTTYKVYMNDSGTFTETDLIYEGTATQFQTADMGYERTYYWKVLPINAHGSDPTCPTWSFSTPLENQLAEGFENTVPPVGWSSVGTAWSRSSTYKVEGTYSAYKAGSTSSQYILSTPLLTIIEGSTLQFGALGTTTSASLEIVYSEDRTTWTQIGSTITFPVATTFYPQVIDLSDLAGNNYYLGFRTGLTSGSTYIDHVIGPEITPVLPGAPVLTAPANAAVNQSNYPSFTWTAPTTGGVPSGYNLYLDTVDGSTLYASNVTSPYVPTTALDWEVTYYWTVKALNNAGTGDAPAARSFTVRSDPTIYVDSTTPWLVDFGTSSSDTFPPTNWTRLSGLFQTDTPTTTSSGWLRDDWLNGASGNNAAKVNIYGTSCKYWLVTPPISIPATGYELKFDLGLTDYTYSTAIEFPEGQADDRFIVVMSDSPSMSNPTILREYNNSGSDYVYNNIPNTGSTVSIPLTGVSGTKYFAFYGESTVSVTGEDNDLFVDNVLIRETVVAAPDPVTLISPADEAENMPVDGFNLIWSPAVTGGTPTGYLVLMGSNPDPDFMDYFWELGDVTNFDPTQAAESPVTFAYGETWYWTVIALNGDGESTVPTSFSFTIMDDPRVLSLPYSQNFDGVTSPNLPAQWVGMVNPTSTSWYVDTYSSTTYAVSQPNTARMYNSSSTTADIRLISPEVVVPMNSIKLSFSARGSSTGYTLLVGTVNALDGTGVFNQLASIPLTAVHTTYSVSFADYVGTDQYICFKHGLGGTSRSIYIDDVYMEELTPNDLAVTAFTGNGYGIAGDQLSYTVTVMNNGTAAQASYSVQLLSQAREVLATLNVSESLEPAASAQHTINWTPSIADTYDVYAKVILAGDANPTNDESDIMQVSVFASTSYISAIGDPASTSTVNYLPFNVYYKNNVAEVIYLGSQMQMASGTINAIIYQNNFTQDLTKPVRIWMAHTTESVNSAWLPFVNYTLVFEGNVHFPLGVNAVIIPLDTPFNYTGGNLAVRTYREFEDNWWDTSNHFYYTMDANYPNRTRYLNRDGDTPIDPTAPDANGTATSYIPNTAFIVDPHTAMPPLTAPAVQIAMDGINPKLTWNAVDGAYLYVVQGSDDPYDWNAATELTVTPNLLYTITSAPAKKFYRVLSRSYNHQDREIGQVFNPASVIGFDNSAVRALPSIPNTEDKN